MKDGTGLSLLMRNFRDGYPLKPGQSLVGLSPCRGGQFQPRFEARRSPRVGIPKQSLGTRKFILSLALAIPAIIAAMPSRVLGAEQIFISYGPLQLTLPVSALEVYAREGKINDDLAFYARYIKPEQLAQLRNILLTRADVSPVAVAQFLYTPQGEVILRRVGEVIQTKAFQPGFYAIRAALIQAAADPEGLTLLNVLRNFPTYAVRINSERGFEILGDLTNAIRETQVAIASVEQQAIAEAATTPSDQSISAPLPMATSLNSSQGQDLQQQGPLKWEKQTLLLNDFSRSRAYAVDVYLPQLSGRSAPVIVISHGLGNDRTSFAYLAEHLASYGFAVAVPEHPGSNAERVRELFSGLANEAGPPSEAVDRPLDVKYLLDQLGATYQGRINLQQVGVMGQSFGGYTALALAGAEINFEQLQKDCPVLNETLNLSLLLQCRAIKLPPVDYNLQDGRVKAAIAINPVTSTIFGQSELADIKVPVMLVASSNDTVTPPLAEQILPFTWLTTPDKYLVLLKQGTHFSTMAESVANGGVIPIPVSVIGPDPKIAFNYMKLLSLAFFKTHVAGEQDYQRYLNAQYAQSISQDVLPLSLLQSLTAEQLNMRINRQQRTENRVSPTPQATP
ncbi:alpha/beta hydrolase [Funiculus sociatus]